jgi:2-dehydro-3-deoxygluconokinase
MMNSLKAVTFGEIMLRLSPPGHSRFVQTNTFDVTYGGGEANVAAALANYGLESYFVSKLPDNEIGQSAVNHLRRLGVNTHNIVRGGERIGIYFLEIGASQRPSKVVYDRAHSSISDADEKDFDWDAIFEGKDWFHWTGITPAISRKAEKLIVVASKKAKEHGLKISCDLNFRKKLWTEKEAQGLMVPMMEYVDVCIANEEDAEKSLGMKAGSTDVEGADLDEKGYFDLAKQLKEKFEFEVVAITLRESFSASRNGWSAILHDSKDCSTPCRSSRYDIQIVDRVGGGDSFASGLIYGLNAYDSSKDALEFAVAASCLKQTIPGDFNHVNVEEVEKLVKSGGSGRVER